MYTAKDRSQKCAVNIEHVKNKSHFKKPDLLEPSSMTDDHIASEDLNVATSLSLPMSPALSFSDIRWSEPMNELFDACVK